MIPSPPPLSTPWVGLRWSVGPLAMIPLNGLWVRLALMVQILCVSYAGSDDFKPPPAFKALGWSRMVSGPSLHDSPQQSSGYFGVKWNDMREVCGGQCSQLPPPLSQIRVGSAVSPFYYAGNYAG